MLRCYLMDPDTGVSETEKPQRSYSFDFTADQSSAIQSPNLLGREGRTLLEHRHWRTQGIRLHSRVVHREVYDIGTAGPSATAAPVARELAKVHDPLVAQVGATEIALPQLHLLLLELQL